MNLTSAVMPPVARLSRNMSAGWIVGTVAGATVETTHSHNVRYWCKSAQSAKMSTARRSAPAGVIWHSRAREAITGAHWQGRS